MSAPRRAANSGKHSVWTATIPGPSFDAWRGGKGNAINAANAAETTRSRQSSFTVSKTDIPPIGQKLKTIMLLKLLINFVPFNLFPG
jgi:hypothetical protein